MEKNPANRQSRRKFFKQTLQAGLAFTIVPRFVLGRGYTAPSDRITLGFIGTGKQGKILLGYFNKNTQTRVLAGSDVDSRKLESFQLLANKLAAEKSDTETYKGLRLYADFRELIERKDIDAVVIATPDHWHAVQSVMAADKGKHVYCEKPMAHSVGEGRAMVNAMKRNKVIMQTGSMQRSSDRFRDAVNLVRNGAIGKVKEVLVTVGDPAIPCDLPEMPVPANLNWDAWIGPSVVHTYHTELSPPLEEDVYPHWRNYKEYGGGLLSDWGAHMFDIAQWGLDMDRSGPVKFEPPAGNAVQGLTMTYQSGIVMRHVDFGRKYAVRFIGENGSIDVSRGFLDSKPENIITTGLGTNAKKVYFSNNHYQDWIDGIKNNKQPICDVETGHRSASVCALANIAYWLRRPLEWDPEKEQFKNDKEANALLMPKMRTPWKV